MNFEKINFIFDDEEELYKAELNGITFICEEVQADYKQYARDLAESYESKLKNIAGYIRSDIEMMSDVSDTESL
ncbi:MAG: hypothetical protein K1V95_09005 [Eubacterium sp.]